MGAERTVGYAAGAFDLFHVGHLNILKQASEYCDQLIAGVVSDEICLQTKGRRPIIPLVERLEIVRNIKYVDVAIVEANIDRIATWRETGFDIYFKGDDWKNTAKGRQLEHDFDAVGVSVVYFPYTVHTSSTVLRKTLEAISSPALASGGGQLV